MPRQVKPMLATLASLPADDDAYGYEIKWDGVRAIAYCSAERIALKSRNLKDITARYPEVRKLARRLGSREVVLDGEIVAFHQGRPDFQRLQARMHLGSESAVRRRAAQTPVTYIVFDLLHLDGRSTMSLPYRKRRELLDELGLSGPAWQTPSYHQGDGRALFAASRDRGLEGIVAKRLDSPYVPGRRSRYWLKVKNVRSQEIVIGGWLPGKGRRSQGIGALLAGYYSYEEGGGKLKYAGKVGTGFSDADLRRLAEQLEPLRVESSPFSGRQPAKGAVFVEPRLVGEVEFNEWTRAGTLRHPSFKGLRPDKEPAEVVREEPGGKGTSPPRRDASKKRAPRSGRRRGRISQRGEGLTEIEGREVKLSNLDKVMYPRAGFTKGDVIDYYSEVADALLPYLIGRPVTLKRYPNGVEGKFFYEKECPSWRPDWVRTAGVWSDRKRRDINYCLIDDLPSLVWAANLADLELHTMLARAEGLDRPTMVAFDLDPGQGLGVLACAGVALRIRDFLAEHGLSSYAKSSGSKGLHVHVPLNTPVGYEETKPFARDLARTLEREQPKQVVSRMTKKLRAGKVFVDWSQNSAHKSTVAPFSLRARERPTVATPLGWDELSAAVHDDDAGALQFEAADVVKQLDRRAKLFEPVVELEQSLPEFEG